MQNNKEKHDALVKQFREDDNKNKLRINYDLSNDSIVLDFGAYEGNWAGAIYNKYKPNIYLYEPVNHLYNSLIDRFKNNNKIKIFNYAVGAINESKEITIHKDASSFYEPINGNKTIVKVASIIDIIEPIEQIDLIKLNIEGSEYEVLESIIKYNLLSKIKNLQIQFHRCVKDYKKRRDFIRHELSKTHICKYNYDFVWEGWSLKPKTTEV